MGIAVNTELAKEMIAIAIRAGRVPMVKGSPGTGKSAIIKELAKEYGLKVIDLRLSQCDPTDLLGFPDINEEKTLASYIPMSTFPTEHWTVPKGYNGWLLFLDEMNSADRGVQKAAYKLVLDQMVGEFNLHPKCAMVGAGNLDTDGAIVEEQSTAMQSRLIHINLVVENDPWLRWASRFGLDHRITDYVKFKPGNLYNFNPEKNNEDTYACFRTWEFVHDLLTKGQLDIEGAAAIPLLAGTVGEGVAREFVAFVELYKDLPKMSQIKSAPATTFVPVEPGSMFALTGSIAHHIDDTNDAPLMEYVERMPIEFQVISLREMSRRGTDMLALPAVKNWIATNNTELF